jgi:putative transport protein
LGLSVFIAVIGISAGPKFVRGIAQAGIMLPLARAVIVYAAYLVAVLFGSHVLKINSGVLFGTCGARTSAGALAAIRDVASSSVPTLGYGIAYAIGNVLAVLSGTFLATVLT